MKNFLHTVLQRYRPRDFLTSEEVSHGLKLVIWDGLTTEVMTSLTSGVFLVAVALLFGASNFQVGLLAALPTLTNIFQLISVWLVQRYNNKRIISFICSYLARLPLLLMGTWILLSGERSFPVFLFFLFLYYFFGSIAGPAWNAWMKDLVPASSLGSYFSQRTRYTQTLNVVLNLSLALLLDIVRKKFPGNELLVYACFFILAGSVGILGAYFLSLVPEKKAVLSGSNIRDTLRLPLKNTNFRKLLIFNCAWVFALNLALPFFTVFMIRTMHLPISLIMLLSISSQLFGIFTIRLWGISSDRYSNKTIIALCGPLYIFCMVAWCFVGIYSSRYANWALLLGIHILMGISSAGVNLSLTNIGLKLSPRQDTIVYLSVKNIFTAFFSSLAPILGGLLADRFSVIHVKISAEFTMPHFHRVVRLVHLYEWNFLFLAGALLGILALQLLAQVKETGEVDKNLVRRILQTNFRRNLRESFLIGDLLHWHHNLLHVMKQKKKRRNKSK